MILDVVPKVVEIANQLIDEDSTNDNGYPTTALSNLCRLHDELMETCQRHPSTGEALQRTFLLYQLARDQRQYVTELITLEADLYRSVVGLSLYLLRTFPPSTLGESTIQDTLNHTIRQSFLLLTILANLYSFATGVMVDAAPTQFPVLAQWIESQQEYWTEQQSSTILSFDRHDLAMEEDQLLHMANTPTPWESNGGVQRSIEENESSLLAQIPSSVIRETDPSSTNMIQVQFTRQGGMIRLLDPIEGTTSSWWAALTASSTIHSQPPMLTITSVVLPTSLSAPLDSEDTKNDGWTIRMSSLQLQVVQNGEKWCVALSSVIGQLKELEQLYDDVWSLWPKEPSQSQSPTTNVRTGSVIP